MPAAYPFTLRTILSAGKSRTQPAAFSMSEPRRGYAYVQPIGTDTPVFWDVAFRFRAAEAAAFMLWFRGSAGLGVDEFTMPIRTEFGLIDHTCRFLPDSLLDTSQEAEVFTYRAQIMARAQVVPASYTAAADMILGLGDWDSWASLLDSVVTAEVPAV